MLLLLEEVVELTVTLYKRNIMQRKVGAALNTKQSRTQKFTSLT